MVLASESTRSKSCTALVIKNTKLTFNTKKEINNCDDQFDTEIDFERKEHKQTLRSNLNV